MNIQKGRQDLPYAALSELPMPNADAKTITALVKDNGRVIGYQLSDGRVLTKEEAITVAKQGDIKDVGISERRGVEYLKSLPDGEENNNLGNLPSIPMPDSWKTHIN